MRQGCDLHQAQLPQLLPLAGVQDRVSRREMTVGGKFSSRFQASEKWAIRQLCHT
jgi:hypothetical protein